MLKTRARAALLGCTICVGWAVGLNAQTDFYNTDKGRPVVIEDAYPLERYGFELQLAPLRLERQRGGIYNWGIEPEIAYGILPHMHVEIGFPLVYQDAGALQGRRTGLAGIDVSMLYNLNVETAGLPAMAIATELALPVGGLAADQAYASFKGIATRTYRWIRFQVNGSATLGPTPSPGDDIGVEEVSRWLAGLAIDRTFPLRSTLITAEIYARDPITADSEVEWNAGAGLRKQLTPRLAIDGGIGKRLTGDDPSWFFTFGTAYAFAVRSLIPVGRYQ
ncbi:MAG: hypothetical protein WEE89_16700 [Gemmatimonadota bacterium]